MKVLPTLVDLSLQIESEDSLEGWRWREAFDQLPVGNLTRFALMTDLQPSVLTESIVRWLPRMTRLRTLRLSVGWSFSSYAGVTRAICSLDHLTDLRISLPYTELEPNPAALLMALVDCAHLTRLGISYLQLDTDLLQQFITHLKSAAHLRHLTISDPYASPLPGGDDSACFASMPRLEELVLSSFDTPPADLVRHAHHAASLRLIRLTLYDIRLDTIEAVRQVHAARQPAVQLGVLYWRCSPPAEVQELLAIDPKRITCEAY